MAIDLSADGGLTWTTARTDARESTRQATTIPGGATDLWGRSWTTDQLSAANFRIRIRMLSDNASRDFFLDWIPITVYYSSP